MIVWWVVLRTEKRGMNRSSKTSPSEARTFPPWHNIAMGSSGIHDNAMFTSPGWWFQPTPLKNDGVKVSGGWWNSQVNGKSWNSMVPVATNQHKPSMTGNGLHTTIKNGDDWGMVRVALFFHHMERSLPPRQGTQCRMPSSSISWVIFKRR